jgi:hypothetical protein
MSSCHLATVANCGAVKKTHFYPLLILRVGLKKHLCVTRTLLCRKREDGQSNLRNKMEY